MLGMGMGSEGRGEVYEKRGDGTELDPWWERSKCVEEEKEKGNGEGDGGNGVFVERAVASEWFVGFSREDLDIEV